MNIRNSILAVLLLSCMGSIVGEEILRDSSADAAIKDAIERVDPDALAKALGSNNQLSKQELDAYLVLARKKYKLIHLQFKGWLSILNLSFFGGVAGTFLGGVAGSLLGQALTGNRIEWPAAIKREELWAQGKEIPKELETKVIQEKERNKGKGELAAAVGPWIYAGYGIGAAVMFPLIKAAFKKAKTSSLTLKMASQNIALLQGALK